MALIYVGRRVEKGIVITPPRKSLEDFYWNPSITKHKGEIYVSFRGYQKKEGIWRGYTSPLAVGKLVGDKVIGLKVLTPLRAPDNVKSNGVEDIRIWSDGKKLMGVGIILFKRSDNGLLGVEVGELSIDYDNGTYSIEKRFGNPRDIPEKNWSPIDGKPYEYLYSIHELYKNGEIISLDQAMMHVKEVHNGTPLIKVGNEYIGVFHQRTRLSNNIFRYPNVFIKYDKNLKPIERSGWFVFDDEAHQEVQFISGALKVEDELWLTVGIDRITARTEADYKGMLYKVKLEDISWKPFEYNLQIKRGILT